MENLDLVFNQVYKNKKILVTGHTGFKGSWLTHWLQKMEAEVIGISLNINNNSRFINTNIDCESYEIDINDNEKLLKQIKEINPDFIFHLAAQSIVLQSLDDPIDTWNTNVIGTLNVLNSSTFIDNLKAVICVTSDKCYEVNAHNDNNLGYIENDRLGGNDPYSASKAASEILINSYRVSFINEKKIPLIASVRAGNIIGGGDWANNRIIPDIIRSIKDKTQLIIRSPNAIRPWQHVLDCLYGYLTLGMFLLQNDYTKSRAWNFGPTHNTITIIELLNEFKNFWPEINWIVKEDKKSVESKVIQLDSSKAKNELNWQPVWSFKESVKKTAQWYEKFLKNEKVITNDQIEEYIIDARVKNSPWI